METNTGINTKSKNTRTVDTKTRFRIDLAKSNYERFKKVQAELKTRGVEEFTLSLYINYIIEKTDLDNKVISDLTPIEFKLKKALLDENLRKKLEKLVSG